MTKIISNYHPRELFHGGMVPMSLFNDQFDYIKVCSEEFNESRFFEYGGQWYDITEFTLVPKDSDTPIDYWDGISHNTYDSGILVKLLQDDMVIVGRFF